LIEGRGRRGRQGDFVCRGEGERGEREGIAAYVQASERLQSQRRGIRVKGRQEGICLSSAIAQVEGIRSCEASYIDSKKGKGMYIEKGGLARGKGGPWKGSKV
jgi:hypothetical protein